MFPTLFTKVMFLLTMSLGFGALGAYFGRGIRSLGAIIGLAIAFIVGAIVVYVAASAAPPVAISLLLGWTFIAGLFMGPTLQLYSEELGWQPVMLCFGGTAGIMAVCGMIGMLSGVDFSGMGTYLMIGLFGMIIFGVVAMFVRMSRTVSIVHAIIGVFLFSGYFIFDFFRLTKSTDTWPEAVRLSASLFLDFINVFLYLLQLYAQLNKH